MSRPALAALRAEEAAILEALADVRAWIAEEEERRSPPPARPRLRLVASNDCPVDAPGSPQKARASEAGPSPSLTRDRAAHIGCERRNER